MSNILRLDAKNAHLFSKLYPKPGISGEDKIRQLLADHLIRLSPEDRYLRFFSTLPNDAIKAYVNRIDFDKDGIFVVFDESLEAVQGFLHASKLETKFEVEYEFGLTVEEDQRGSGIGYDLFAKAIEWANGLGGKRIYVNCLSKNKAMQKIAEKFKMETRSIDYETREGELQLQSHPNMFAYMYTTTANNITLYDMAARKQIHEAIQSYTDAVHNLTKIPFGFLLKDEKESTEAV